MNANPILKALGYSNNDRLVIIHADDIGMCHASVQAFTDLNEFGLISSGATMTPCSWFPKIADYCRHNPSVDMGVHLTLTSEWVDYRWSPLSTRDPASGLLDEDGYFHSSSENAQISGNPDSVKIELDTQIQKALTAGIEITHLDTHMNTVAHKKYVATYLQLAIQYKLPILFPRLDEEGFHRLGIDRDAAVLAASSVHILEEQGIPLVDHATGLYLDSPDGRMDQAMRVLEQLPVGITHFIIHPSIDTPELKAVTPDWKCRVADYQTFMNEDIRKYINSIGVNVIGYKALNQLIGS